MRPYLRPVGTDEVADADKVFVDCPMYHHLLQVSASCRPSFISLSEQRPAVSTVRLPACGLGCGLCTSAYVRVRVEHGLMLCQCLADGHNGGWQAGTLCDERHGALGFLLLVSDV